MKYFKVKYISIVLIIVSLSSFSILDRWKELDLKVFKLSIPSEWSYKEEQGEDSFLGKIASKNCSLSFDYSSHGYANGLIQTEQEYIKQGEWNRGYFYKVGVTYTANFNVENEKKAQMKKLGTSDSALVHVKADPSYQTQINVVAITPKQKTRFTKADYIATLKYQDSVVIVPIEIPIEIKSHNITIDTTDSYFVKTISPKIPTKGITGIYIKSRFSSLNFKMSGYGLSLHDQELALQAFKTIKLKHR